MPLSSLVVYYIVFPFEQSVLKDIDKGEIISSSAPQLPKDGRNSTEFTHSRRMKPVNAPFQGTLRIEASLLIVW